MKLKAVSLIMIASMLASTLLVSLVGIGSAPFQVGATSKFYIKLPSGGTFMNVSAAHPYDIGDKFNITVGIANVTEMTGYCITFAWNATYMNATGNYWLDSFFIGEILGSRWSAASIEYITNDLATQVGNPLLPPLIGMFTGFGQTALGAKYNLTGTYDIVKIEFRINAYGPHGFYIWKDPSNYDPWPYNACQPYLQQEGAFPAAWHETYSGWKNATGHKPDYNVVWCAHPLFAPPTPLSGRVSNAMLWIQPPSPYPPTATKTHTPLFPLVYNTVTFTVTQTKAGFDGAATHDISNVTIDYGGISPLEWQVPVAGVATFVHTYTAAGTYTVWVFCYAAGMPAGLEWCNLTQSIDIYAPCCVGGKATPINLPINKPELLTPWIWLSTIILPLVATAIYVKRVKRRKKKR